jgi:hypothetical protein
LQSRIIVYIVRRCKIKFVINYVAVVGQGLVQIYREEEQLHCVGWMLGPAVEVRMWHYWKQQIAPQPSQEQLAHET